MHTEYVKQRILACIRVVGPYGQNYESATQKLYEWAGAHSPDKGECIFTHRGNPEVTPAAQCRTNICLSMPDGGDVEKRILPAGGDAIIRRTAPTRPNSGILGRIDGRRGGGRTADGQQPPLLRALPCRRRGHPNADVGFYIAIAT